MDLMVSAWELNVFHMVFLHCFLVVLTLLARAVGVGALVGVGLVRGHGLIDRKAIERLATIWTITVPTTATISAILYVIQSQFINLGSITSPVAAL